MLALAREVGNMPNLNRIMIAIAISTATSAAVDCTVVTNVRNFFLSPKDIGSTYAAKQHMFCAYLSLEACAEKARY